MSQIKTLREPSKVAKLGLLALLLSLGACKQNEFFEKPQLSEVTTKTKSTDENGTDTSGGTTTPTNVIGDTNGGFGTDPALDPVLNLPDINPPVVISPPVVINPPVIISPPVIVNPPVVILPPPNGVGLLSRSEIFTQNTNRNGDVDILWVVDDSGSMADNQAALAQNFQNFVDQFLKKDIDFKMAITTTDGTISRNGKMVGDSHLFTQSAALSNKAAFLSNFSRWIKVGTNGSGTEQGLKCAASFFDRYGASFIRKDAFLAIVFISDEEDQSEKKVTDYLSKFLSLKANKGMVKAYSIVTQKIPQHAEWESIGTRYNLVSQVTGGASSDITDNFATTLNNLGGTIVNLIDKFALAETPYANSVEVYVNNTKQDSGWVYDSTSKTVQFLANNIPAEGASINIKYSVTANLIGSN